MSRASSAGNAAQQEQTESRAVIDDEAQVVPQGNQDANSEQQVQSSSTEDATDATLASVIRDAIKPEKADVPASSDRENGGETDESNGGAKQVVDGEKPTNEADKTPAEDADVPFHKHPRWKQLKQERDTFKASHEQFEQIQGFMASNHLDAAEVARGFEIMALLRNDPERAYAALQPYMQQLELVTARRLPEDLQERVNNDVLDPETAKETARLRLVAEQNQQAAQALLDERNQSQQVNQVQGIQHAVSAVEQEIQSGDPDYARKQPFVMDRVRALIIEKQPRTIEAATAIVRQAHAEISERLKPMVGQRKPVSTVTSSDSASGGSAAPKSFAEAVRQAAKATG
jgi:hypothetical protein